MRRDLRRLTLDPRCARAFQLVFNGQGFVIVQASEGRIVAPHTH